MHHNTGDVIQYTVVYPISVCKVKYCFISIVFCLKMNENRTAFTKCYNTKMYLFSSTPAHLTTIMLPSLTAAVLPVGFYFLLPDSASQEVSKSSSSPAAGFISRLVMFSWFSLPHFLVKHLPNAKSLVVSLSLCFIHLTTSFTGQPVRIVSKNVSWLGRIQRCFNTHTQ